MVPIWALDIPPRSPSHRKRAPAGGRPTPVYPINLPDAKPDRSMQRTRIVDQLYEELMRSSGVLVGVEECLNRGWMLKMPPFRCRPTEKRSKIGYGWLRL